MTALEAIAVEAVTLDHALVRLDSAIYLADAHAVAGNPEAGLTALSVATAAACEEAAFLSVPVDRVRATCLMALGRFDEAERCLDDALRGAVRQQMPYEQLIILRARVELAHRRDLEPRDRKSVV